MLFGIKTVAIMLAMIAIFFGCGDGSGDGKGGSPADYSGTYCVSIENDTPMTMEIDQSDSDVKFTITVDDETIEGAGTLSGNTMNLAGKTPEGDEVTAVVKFSDDGQSFTGSYEIAGGEHDEQGSLSGKKGECEADTSLSDISEIMAAKSDTLYCSDVKIWRKGTGCDPDAGFKLRMLSSRITRGLPGFILP